MRIWKEYPKSRTGGVCRGLSWAGPSQGPVLGMWGWSLCTACAFKIRGCHHLLIWEGFHSAEQITTPLVGRRVVGKEEKQTCLFSFRSEASVLGQKPKDEQHFLPDGDAARGAAGRKQVAREAFSCLLSTQETARRGTGERATPLFPTGERKHNCRAAWVFTSRTTSSKLDFTPNVAKVYIFTHEVSLSSLYACGPLIKTRPQAVFKRWWKYSPLYTGFLGPRIIQETKYVCEDEWTRIFIASLLRRKKTGGVLNFWRYGNS